MSTVYGISGKKESGKDTAYTEYFKYRGFVRVAFADDVKEIASAAYNIPLTHFYENEHKEAPLRQYPVLPEMAHLPYKFVDGCWTPRAFAQFEGDQKRRVDPDFWIKRTFSRMDKNTNYVITDLRYRNEAEYLRAAGAKLIRVNRHTLPANAEEHESETALDTYEHFDHVIQNTTNSIENYILQLESVCGK
jgi:hypothetical protein